MGALRLLFCRVVLVGWSLCAGRGPPGWGGEDGSPSQACAPPGPSPRKRPLASAGTLGKGRHGFCRRGGAFPPRVVAHIPTVRCMGMPAKSIIGTASPGRPFRGYHLHCSRRGAGEEREARAGWGRGEQCMGFSSRLRPSRAITTIAPDPAREPWGRVSMVLFDGEGVPSPTPPWVISPRSGAWDDAGEGHNQDRHPGHAFPEISPALPPPGAGEEREARAGWGREENSVWGFLPDYALSRLSPR